MISAKKMRMYLRNPMKLLLRTGKNSFLRIVKDEYYVRLIFKNRMGYSLNLKNPQTFNEKLQWLKLFDHKPEYTKLVDKYWAKEYAAQIIGGEHIIPTLGVWNTFDEIDFEKLPRQFVLKCTHDSGGLVICRDKGNFDKERARKKINRCLKVNYYWSGREWPYKLVKPCIIAEAYMEENLGDSSKEKGLVDYKFFCFSGEPRMLYVSRGLEDHKSAQISFYDLGGEEMPFHRSDYRQLDKIVLPNNYCNMKDIAKKLSASIDSAFVRIDLYSVNGKVYFSEVTFSPCSGMIPFEPKEWDKKLGSWLSIN